MTRHPIPEEAQDDRLGFVGTAGSGKTYNSCSAVEQILQRHGRVIIPDPLGVWWGLRLRADGRTPSPFNVVIFGGPHGDLPINEHAGALVGEAVANATESCIIDLSQLGTKAAERRFMLAFLTALYRKTSGEPVHLIFDEADMWAPQQLRDKDGDAAKLLGMMETVVRRGRIKGFMPWLITQRPAVLSKDVLSQIDGLVAFKLTSAQDRDAIGDWVKGSADLAQWKAIWAELPTKQRGEGVVWLPSRGILETAKFPVKGTFDSSRTPKRGERLEAVKLRPIDIGKLAEKLKAVEEETKASDPAKLRAEIAQLKRQLAQSQPQAESPKLDPAALQAADHAGYKRGKVEGYREGLDVAGAALQPLRATVSRLVADIDNLQSDFVRLDAWRRNPPAPKQAPAGESVPHPKWPPIGAAEPYPATRTAPMNLASPAEQRGGGPELRILRVLVARAPARFTRAQWATLAGMKKSGGTWSTYVSRLRTAGYIDEDGGQVSASPAGIAAAGPVQRPAAGSVIDQWKHALGTGPSKMIDAVLGHHPRGIDRANLAELVGMVVTGGTFSTYLSRLKTNGLVEIRGRKIVATEILFTDGGGA